MEKPSKTIDVPVLKDVLVPGKVIPGNKTSPLGLSEVQLNILQQQIEEIVQKRLQAVLNKASQDAVRDIKAYLDKALPEFIKTAQKKK